MFTKKEISAIKKATKNKAAKLSKEEVNLALGSFNERFDQTQLAEFFDVDRFTISRWVKGLRKPSGANKVVFNAILYKIGYKK